MLSTVTLRKLFVLPRRVARSKPSSLLGLSLASACALGADAALAQSSRPQPIQSKAVQVSQPAGPLIGVISLRSQKVTFYNRHGVVAQSPISSGRKGYETPEGVFSILERKEEHFSNLYDDASMPFMQRLTWSGVAMHAGNVPGYPASHGCVRLPASFAEQLFELTRVNTRVVVTQQDVAPLPIEHSRLFQPSFVVVPAADARPAAPAPLAPQSPRPALKSDDGATETPMMLGVRPGRPAVPEVAAPPNAPQQAVTSLVEAARLQQLAANQRAAEAVKAADAAKLLVRTKVVEAQKTERVAKSQDVLARRAEGKVMAAERAVARARSDEAIAKAKVAYDAAVVERDTLKKSADEMRVAAVERAAEARAATEAAKAGELARNAAQAEARAATRLLEPISVFVSRQAGRLYVRQGRNPVFDAPFTISDPQRPIGTHVFTAMEQDGPNRVRWRVVTVESGVPVTPLPPQPRKRGEPRAEPAPAPAAVNYGAAVLARLEFSNDVLDRITPYVQLGSSLVVSDLPPSIETGKGTDFVVLTRGEERAREFIANYVAEQKAEQQRAEQQKRAGQQQQRAEQQPRFEQQKRTAARERERSARRSFFD